MLCGWGGKRRSGVALTMRYRLVLRAKGLQRSPDPLSVFKEPTSKGWEGERKGRGQAPKYFGLEPPLREKGRENRYDPTCTYTLHSSKGMAHFTSPRHHIYAITRAPWRWSPQSEKSVLALVVRQDSDPSPCRIPIDSEQVSNPDRDSCIHMALSVQQSYSRAFHGFIEIFSQKDKDSLTAILRSATEGEALLIYLFAKT